MSDHTPGPWTLGPCSHGGLLVRRGASVGRGAHPQHSLQIVPEADAHLIAAAPELLAALKELRASWAWEEFAASFSIAALLERADKAIAKAEGRSDDPPAAS
jgi:hypothetical protein